MRKAENDLMAAKAIVEYYEEPPTDTVCYHCHQVVEKGLKGMLAYYGADLVKVHDLVELLNLSAQHDSDLEAHREDVETLNQYYIEAKYPLDQPISYSVLEAKQAIKKAEEIFNKVLRKIGHN